MLDDNQNVHDVAALLKEFFRDMKDSLLPDDLYMSFLLTASELLVGEGEQAVPGSKESRDVAQATGPHGIREARRAQDKYLSAIYTVTICQFKIET